MIRNCSRPLLAQTRPLAAPLRLPLSAPCRFYAHSRFRERRPGSSRVRDRPERLVPRQRPGDSEEKTDADSGGEWHVLKFGPFSHRYWESAEQRAEREELANKWQNLLGRADAQRTKQEEPPSKRAEQEEPPPKRTEQEESPLWEAAKERTPASDPREGLERLLMGNDMLMITRQIEMLNIFVGFEQSNRYVITNENEEVLGYIAEEPRGFLSMFSRQLFRTHRPFRALVMDSAGSPILWLRRPFAWINSRMFVQRLKDFAEYNPEGEPVLDTFAEVQQRWHIWRRRYDLFLREQSHRILSTASEPQPEPALEPESFRQMARIDSGFLAWHFTLNDARGEEMGSVDRTFRGLGREIFTDTGRYYVRFGPRSDSETSLDSTETPKKPTVMRNLTLDERALILATAVNIDFDYFSRHSGGGWGPLFFLSAWE